MNKFLCFKTLENKFVLRFYFCILKLFTLNNQELGSYVARWLATYLCYICQEMYTQPVYVSVAVHHTPQILFLYPKIMLAYYTVTSPSIIMSQVYGWLAICVMVPGNKIKGKIKFLKIHCQLTGKIMGIKLLAKRINSIITLLLTSHSQL